MKPFTSTKTVRQSIMECLEHAKKFPVLELPVNAWCTDPDYNPSGVSYNKFMFDDGDAVLTSPGEELALPVEILPASALYGVICALRHEATITAEMTGASNPEIKFYEMPSTWWNIIKDIDEKISTFLDKEHLSGRQAFECLLILGGPGSPEDMTDDGSGKVSLLTNWAANCPMPYVVCETEDSSTPTIHAVDAVDWTNQGFQIRATLSDSVTGKQFEFDFLPGGMVLPRCGQENSFHMPAESLYRLETILWRIVSNEILFEEKTKRNNPGKQARQALCFNAIKALVKKHSDLYGNEGEYKRCVSFDRRDYEHLADIPHVRTDWGGTAAISNVWLISGVNDESDETVVIESYPVCGMMHARQYNGSENVEWDRILSAIYSEFQGPDDPEWEEWLEEFRKSTETRA